MTMATTNLESLYLDPVVAWILRPALAVLFATAASHKLRDLSGFMRTLAGYEIISRRLAGPFALGLISTEALVSIGLMVGLFGLVTPDVRAGLAACALLAMYAMAIGINLARGRNDIDCGCLGPKATRQPLSGWLLWRNGILMTGAALTCLPLSSRPLGAIDGVSILGGLILVILIFSAANQLAATPRLVPNQESIS